MTDTMIKTIPSTMSCMINAQAHTSTVMPIAIHLPQRDAISLDSFSLFDLQSTPTLRNLYPLP